MLHQEKYLELTGETCTPAPITVKTYPISHGKPSGLNSSLKGTTGVTSLFGQYQLSTRHLAMSLGATSKSLLSHMAASHEEEVRGYQAPKELLGHSQHHSYQILNSLENSIIPLWLPNTFQSTKKLWKVTKVKGVEAHPPDMSPPFTHLFMQECCHPNMDPQPKYDKVYSVNEPLKSGKNDTNVHAETTVIPKQNGFFEGRLIDDNIMAVSNNYVLKHYKVPAQLLFTDFSKAYYDNLDQNTIIHILEHIGMPQTWTTIIAHLMQNTEAYLPSGIHFPLEVLAAHPPRPKIEHQLRGQYRQLINKAQRRAQDIIPKVLGLQRKIVATNIYIHSILQYQCRFEIFSPSQVWHPYMTKIFHLVTPSNCTSLEHLMALKKQGGLATSLLDMHNPLIKDAKSLILSSKMVQRLNWVLSYKCLWEKIVAWEMLIQSFYLPDQGCVMQSRFDLDVIHQRLPSTFPTPDSAKSAAKTIVGL
ncbi:hypothetical protein Pelo_18086 [Pelomyxa schiedti]|nr:hypothetical protein Pelo_18086 [Pelomyxa schiedti]